MRSQQPTAGSHCGTAHCACSARSRRLSAADRVSRTAMWNQVGLLTDRRQTQCVMDCFVEMFEQLCALLAHVFVLELRPQEVQPEHRIDCVDDAKLLLVRQAGDGIWNDGAEDYHRSLLAYAS